MDSCSREQTNGKLNAIRFRNSIFVVFTYACCWIIASIFSTTSHFSCHFLSFIFQSLVTISSQLRAVIYFPHLYRWLCPGTNAVITTNCFNQTSFLTIFHFSPALLFVTADTVVFLKRRELHLRIQASSVKPT